MTTEILSLAEREHAHRARGLREWFTEDRLAEFLHQNYRAAAKALAQMHEGPYHSALLHDHGWGDCYGRKKAYFLRRARWLMADRPAANGRVLGS